MQREIEKLKEKFVADLAAMIESDSRLRVADALRQQLAVANERAGLSPWLGMPLKEAKTVRTRRKGPIQLCPVPGCKERAAPVFGMVCAGHKATPKAQIAKYREARRKRVAAGRRA